MNPFLEKIASQINFVVDETIDLGPVTVRLVSNISDFAAIRYFSKKARRPYQNERTDFEIRCISLKNERLELQTIRENIDKTYRGTSFSDGYYATDHFGSPVYMVSSGKTYFVFGDQLECVVWTYFVKYFLILHTIEKNALFLKSAAIAVNGKGTLLLGRGGTGKTSFLSIMCMYGAEFVTNSHSVINQGRITGIASSLRVRPDNWMLELLNPQNVIPALRPGEIIVDPADQFTLAESLPELKNICVVDYRKPARHVIKLLSDEEAYNYAEQFALGLNVYRLEEDLLDHFEGDLWQFSAVYERMKAHLGNIISNSDCYYVSSNLMEKKNREEVFGLFS